MQSMIPTSIGSYRILRVLGEGGMGAVYLGEHQALGRQAAIKVLQPALSARADIVQRFFNEARAATAIRDPGIVSVFDFGHDAAGNAYIVMELLDGESLETRLGRLGRLAPDDTMRIGRQVAAALAAAHARGIVHRDLKPDNIFLVPDREVSGGERAKILDFGIAKLASEQGGSQTQVGAIMGTPAYMAPEQCRGAGEVDARSDIYALGCVLFHMLTGAPPFSGAGMGELLVKHIHEAPPLASSRAIVPEALDRLVARCLEKAPSGRYASMAELVGALDEIRRISVPPAPPYPSPASSLVASIASSPTTLSSAAGATAAPSSPRRGWWMVIAAGGSVAAVAAVIAASSARHGDPPAAPAAASSTVVDGASPDASMIPDAALTSIDAAAAPPDVAAPPDSAPVPPDARRRPSVKRPTSIDPCDRDGDGIPETRC